MTEIRPFRGTRYNDKLLDLSQVVAPPYDVISEVQQEALYKKHPYNVVRLILGRQHEGDGDNNNRYSRAKKFIEEWKQTNVLVSDDRPSIYLYIQRFKAKGRMFERHGFVTLMRIGSDVYTHEKTLSKPKEDRFELMKACAANLSPIFVLYDDEKRCVECITISPAIHTLLAHIKEGDEEHFFYRITDEKIIGTVEKLIGRQKTYIADGHHRYETAIRYRDYRTSMHGRDDDAGYNYVMSYFTNISDPGLVILPTHRVVHGITSSERELVDRLKACFEVEMLSGTGGGDRVQSWVREIEARGKAFGFKLHGSDNHYVLHGYRPLRLRDDPTPEALKSLDVYILNKEILEAVLGIPEQSFSSGGRLSYHHELDSALMSMKEGDAVFVLNAPTAGDVKAVALGGLNMPQKTTYFYPKLLSGLVFHLFGE